MAIHLSEGEKILKTTCPHLLAMVHLYVIWLYLGAIGVTVMVFRPELTDWIKSWPQGDRFQDIIYLTLWAVALLLPAIVISVARINFGWLALFSIICAAGVLADRYDQMVFTGIKDRLSVYASCQQVMAWLQDHTTFRPDPTETENYWLIAVSLFGLLGSNSYRRSHRYYVTNRRIVTRFGFLATRERDLLYSKVDDLIVHQGILGRLFGFGTIIPISASGIGTGSDQVFVAAQAGMQMASGPKISVEVGGGKSVTVPRAPSFYSLYGVKNPGELKEMIFGQMEQREHGYTRRKREAAEENKEK